MSPESTPVIPVREPEPKVSPRAVWQLPAGACRISGSLGPDVSAGLLNRVLAVPAGKLAPSIVGSGELRPDTRRSLSCDDFPAPELFGAFESVRNVVESVLGVQCRGMAAEYVLAVHNDGDFFAPHHDVAPGLDSPVERAVTFVYYLHRSPRPFSGGQLRVYDVVAPADGTTPVPEQHLAWREWEPDHDSIIFFLPTARHEVRPVVCSSKDYADSRFTITGWLGHLADE
ncbi:2OG-Fe(II) oxygenase [Streptomyces triculaminicus]|uniref:2OG-Fe(II) oxygenase n=1 Tax=Streptomyces triculaminicus TaxID=2816232 RepID=UPI00340F10BE